MKKKILSKLISGIIINCFVMSFSNLSVFAASNDKFVEADMSTEEWKTFTTEWEKIKNDYSNLCLTQGEDESKINMNWNIKNSKTVKAEVKIQEATEVVDGKLTDSAKCYTGKTKDGYSGYTTCQVTVSDLKENTKYKYSYWNGDSWSDAYDYETQEPNDFTAIFMGDPQIGACYQNISSIDNKELGSGRANRNDAYVFGELLTKINKKYPKAAILITAGDQVHAKGSDGAESSEKQYVALLQSSVLKGLPLNPTRGNHDKDNITFKYHFNLPNKTGLGQTTAGSDYYYSYGDVLFVTLNGNASNVSEHKNAMDKAIASNPNYNWLIVTMHQDIYGVGQWHSQGDSKALRKDYAKIFEEYDVDVVLSGHDHAYSRSHFISNTTSADSYKVNKYSGNEVVEPEGVLYITGNCSSGSKLYPAYYSYLDYVAKASQSNERTYSKIDFTKNTFTITTYDINDKVIDNPFTIVKNNGSNSVSLESSLGSKFKVGETTRLKAVPRQEDSSLKYTIEVDGQVLLNASSNNETVWTPEKTGTYGIKVKAVDSEGKEYVKTLTVEVKDVNINQNMTTIYYKGYSNAYIHYKVGSGSWTKAPGIAMEKSDEIEGYPYKAEIDMGNAEKLTVCFNDGNGNWDNNSSKNYTFGLGTYTFSNGTIKEIEPQNSKFEINLESDKKIVTVYDTINFNITSNEENGANYKLYCVKPDGKIEDIGEGSQIKYIANKEGEYTFIAEGKNAKGVLDTSKVIINVGSQLLKITSFTTNVASPQEVGKSITLSASATGNGKVRYHFYVYLDGNVVAQSTLSTTKTYLWKPTKAGRYIIKVVATDSTRKIVSIRKTYNVIK